MAGVEIEQPKCAAAGRRQRAGVGAEQKKRASENFLLGIVYNRFQHPGSAWRRVVFAPPGASASVITHYSIQSQRGWVVTEGPTGAQARCPAKGSPRGMRFL